MIKEGERMEIRKIPDEFYLKCQRCGKKWLPRVEKRPVACPRCNSKVWDKPKDKEK